MTAQGAMTGKVFGGRYHIENRIGIGGMAEVYRAQDSVLGRLVAVKVMLPQFASDPDFTRRFRQEAAAAANLQSPYIVNVYDWGEDDGTYYIVMEFVRGSDLKTAIKQRGAINQRKVAEIGSQVCQALTVAHNQDIIHRDIKPQNIMVQPDGNVKVMDFGIARAKNSIKEQTASVLGTAHYISPEQAQGKELTAASDIYSLGIVLYEAATGKLPFDGPDAVSVAMKQVSDSPVPPREINPSISPDLEDIIMCALSKNPSERFATANDMRLALNDVLAGRQVNLGHNSRGIANAETRVMPGVGPVKQNSMPVQDGTQVIPTMGNGPRSMSVNNNNPYGNQNEPPLKKKHTGRNVAISLAVIAAVVALVFGIIFAAGGSNSEGQGAEVPNVVGLTIEQATQELQNRGFELGDVESVNDDSVPQGQIVSQDPMGNTQAESGTRVNVSISQGPEQVNVPNLADMTSEEARKALQDLDLVPSAGTPAYSNDVEQGHVMGQDPVAGTKVSKGSTVTYVLSLGTEIIAVPNVVGYSQSDAESMLTEAGFQVTAEGRYSDSVAEGEVVSQDPSGNSRLEQGGTVTIYVSEGPEPVSVPNVIGYDGDSAYAILTEAGFTVYTATSQVYDSSYPQGYVVDQDPSSGTATSDGATVYIYLNPVPPSSTTTPTNPDEGTDTGGGTENIDNSTPIDGNGTGQTIDGTSRRTLLDGVAERLP